MSGKNIAVLVGWVVAAGVALHFILQNRGLGWSGLVWNTPPGEALLYLLAALLVPLFILGVVGAPILYARWVRTRYIVVKHDKKN